MLKNVDNDGSRGAAVVAAATMKTPKTVVDGMKYFLSKVASSSSLGAYDTKP